MSMSMSVTLPRANDFADLGEVWLRYQTAIIHQKQAQFGGRHYHLDVDALLNQLARAAREARAREALRERQVRSTDHLRRATIEAIEHCARLDHRTSARVWQADLAISNPPAMQRNPATEVMVG